MFIFTPHGFGSLKSFLEPSTEPRRSRCPAASLALSPCSNSILLIMKQNKREAASIEQAIDAKIKEEANKTQLEREQFKASSRCFIFPTLRYRCKEKAQITEINIQSDRSQVSFPALYQRCYILLMYGGFFCLVWVFLSRSS